MKVIFPIICILISVVLFIWIVNPSYNSISILRDDLTNYKLALANSNELQAKQDSLLDVYRQIKQSDKDKLNDFLPSSVDNIQFILEMERIASLHGMPIRDIKFETVKKDNTPVDANTIISEAPIDNKPYGVFPIEFSTEGKYESFMLFLKDLEHSLRLADVKSITFSIPEVEGKAFDGTNPDVYHYNVKVETYWLK